MMRKIVLTFGLLSGAVLALMMVLALVFKEQIGFDKGLVVGYTSMVLAFLMVFAGVKSYRDNVGGGRISFGRAFVVGLLISLIGTACYVATWEVVYFNFMPDYMDKYAEYEIGKAKSAGATEAQIAEKAKQMAEFNEAYKNPLVNIAYTTIEPLPVALVFTLVAAGVMSRKRREDTSTSTT
jgi:hypothetical protein